MLMHLTAYWWYLVLAGPKCWSIPWNPLGRNQRFGIVLFIGRFVERLDERGPCAFEWRCCRRCWGIWTALIVSADDAIDSTIRGTSGWGPFIRGSPGVAYQPRIWPLRSFHTTLNNFSSFSIQPLTRQRHQTLNQWSDKFSVHVRQDFQKHQ